MTLKNEALNQNIVRELKLKWWGPGEWVDEPDYAEFISNGLNCRIRRVYIAEDKQQNHVFGGHLCGYVQLPLNMYMTWDEADDLFKIHGGITYCEEEEGHLWIGFDCGHAWDLCPSMRKFEEEMVEINPRYKMIKGLQEQLKELNQKNEDYFMTPIYRNFDYVTMEVNYLAKQAKTLADKQLGLTMEK